MDASKLLEAIKDLREPYQKALGTAAVMQPKGDLRRLAQVIIGPPQSGKTTEANKYAAALAKSGLVADTEPLRADGGIPRQRDEWVKLFASAENGTLIIDDIYKADPGSVLILGDLMLQSFDAPKLVLVLTGDEEPMKKFLDECRPELRTRMPRPITAEGPFTAEQMAAHHAKLEEEHRVRLEIMRRAEELTHSQREWKEMSEDVTLRKPASAMKPVVFALRNETVN
jgi:hypothetical protein